ncbi:MAG: hypothetical protein COA43_12445 [Robiginitomaculum sp.]|nr:MAG: hypothetical protein COA43_12445 [Robiginitomaculum sp.]
MSVESIFNWGLQTQIAISVLVVSILIIRRSFARAFGAKLAYALWALPLIRLCMPSIKLPAPIKPMPVFLAKPTPNADIMMTTEAPLVSTPSMIEYTEILPTALSQNFALICVSIWLSIAVLWLALQLALQIKFVKTTRTHATVPPENIQCLIDDVRATLNLNREYNVYMAANNIGPSISGIMRPIIILPHNFETIFNPDQQFHALLHEFTHIKRRDLMVALALLVFRALNWPNPLIHYAAQKCRADLEAACDVSVLKAIGHNPGNIQSYAQTLFQAAKSLGANDQNQMNLAFNLVPYFQANTPPKGDDYETFKLW